MFSALYAKAKRSDELRQPIDKIQQRDQLINALLKMKGKYGAARFGGIFLCVAGMENEAGTALAALCSLLE